jgi:hypothetical protein
MSTDNVDGANAKRNSEGFQRRGFSYRPRSYEEWEARCNQDEDSFSFAADEAEPDEHGNKPNGSSGDGDQRRAGNGFDEEARAAAKPAGGPRLDGNLERLVLTALVWSPR